MNAVQTKMLKLLVHTLGRLSDGVRIARKHGFTSGKMVDYVYRNQPSGRALIGKVLDRIYLANEGWQAVRIRRQHLEELLEEAVRRHLADHGRTLVLDIASGQARYLQDTLLKFVGRPVEAVCWDLDERWLEEGQELAVANGLASILYDRADAFDPASYAGLPRRADITIASGFYEWIRDDDEVKRSLALVHAALADGGAFLFTCQTGHVALDMTNEVFRGFGGRPLTITCRHPALVHTWARNQGFAVEQVRFDPWHYHAVTLARKL